MLWLAISGIRLAVAARSLLQQQARIEAIQDAGLLNAEPRALEQVAVSVRDDVAEINAVAKPFAAAGRFLGWLPGIGPVLADAQHLLDMADAGSQLTLQLATVARPLLESEQLGGDRPADSLPQLLTILDAAEPTLRQAQLAADALFESRARLKHVGEYPDRFSTLIDRLDKNASLIRDGLSMAQAAPDLLGATRPMTYLILAQNEDEIRPSGGFISGAGLVTVDQGQIVDLRFDNANLVDDWQHKPYDLPPVPFTEFMGMDIFLFRDANFWPDFAQSAVQALALYSYGQDVALDGVVAIDQQFLQQLLATTGPLPVPDLDRVVDAASIVSQLREEWGPLDQSENWINERKAFMGPLASAFLAQIDNGLLSAKGFELVQMLQTAAQERHLQLFSADPLLADLLDGTAWNGRMDPPAAGDFLHLSDTNMGFNKVNAVVERSLTYQVTLDPDGQHVALLEARYENPPSTNPVECLHGTRYDPDTEYQTLTSDCYWVYLRAYVPRGSGLISSSEHPVPAANLMSGKDWPGTSRAQLADDGRFTVFDNFLLLGTGQTETVSFEYTLPGAILAQDAGKHLYQLHVRKQAGMVAEPISIQIMIPDGARIVDVVPEPTFKNQSSVVFDLSLETDAEIKVTFQE